MAKPGDTSPHGGARVVGARSATDQGAAAGRGTRTAAGGCHRGDGTCGRVEGLSHQGGQQRAWFLAPIKSIGALLQRHSIRPDARRRPCPALPDVSLGKRPLRGVFVGTGTPTGSIRSRAPVVLALAHHPHAPIPAREAEVQMLATPRLLGHALPSPTYVSRSTSDPRLGPVSLSFTSPATFTCCSPMFTCPAL